MKLQFDPTSVPANRGFRLIPAGQYELRIASVEKRKNRGNEGQHLNLDVVVHSGEFANRHVFHVLNLWNESESSREMSKGVLTAICEATGVTADEKGCIETNDFVNKPFMGRIGITRNPQYGQTNVIDSFLPDGNDDDVVVLDSPTAPAEEEAAAIVL